MSDAEPDTDDRDDDRFLEADEVAANLRDYLDVLDTEQKVIERAADALEGEEFGVEDMMDVLPDEMPLEAWERDAYDGDTAYLVGMELDLAGVEVNDGE